MHLRNRLRQGPETVSDLTVAADQKWWEGQDLARTGRFGGAIYLLGYAAEMILKTASFRAEGALPKDHIFPRLGPAKQWLAHRTGFKANESYHSVLFWEMYLRARRSDQNRPFDKTLGGGLAHHTARIYSSWWVEMRYRPDIASMTDFNRIHRSVGWIYANRFNLWR